MSSSAWSRTPGFTIPRCPETSRHTEVMDAVVRRSGASGNLLHDAHIAALCIEHGVAELVTGDRDFRRFEGLRLYDPFADRQV